MNVALRRPMTQDEFFQWAEAQDGRYEFDGIQALAMVGGTNNHGLISSNLIGQLYARLRGSGCRVLGSEGGGVQTVGMVVRYPDAVVTCSPIRGRDRLAPDPVVVFEVLSASTAREDLKEKPAEYAAVASIRRYIVIDQSRQQVTGYVRTAQGGWTPLPSLGVGAVLDLPEIGIVLPLMDLYEDVTFED